MRLLVPCDRRRQDRHRCRHRQPCCACHRAQVSRHRLRQPGPALPEILVHCARPGRRPGPRLAEHRAWQSLAVWQGGESHFTTFLPWGTRSSPSSRSPRCCRILSIFALQRSSSRLCFFSPPPAHKAHAILHEPHHARTRSALNPTTASTRTTRACTTRSSVLTQHGF